MKNFKFLLIGTLFGIILIKAEVVSWFRIQEMFRFQSFHMYGVICSAIVVGLISILIIKKYKIKTFYGEEIKIADKGLPIVIVILLSAVLGTYTYGILKDKLPH